MKRLNKIPNVILYQMNKKDSVGILRNLFNTVMIMMPSIGNVGLIIGIIIVIYGLRANTHL